MVLTAHAHLDIFMSGRLTTSAKSRSGYTKKRHSLVTKIWRFMRITAILLTVFCVQVSARTVSQTITYSGEKVPLEKIFTVIEEQTNYFVVYYKKDIRSAQLVSINAENQSLESFLQTLFANQPFQYTIEGSTISIKRKAPVSDINADHTLVFEKAMNITGVIRDADGNALAGASIRIKGTTSGVSTDAYGRFTIDANVGQVLVISFTGYEEREYEVKRAEQIVITMKQIVSMLDETVVMAYGKTSKRFNTGSIDKVSSTEISQQPVSDPLATLHGKVPGLVVTQSSGVPGGSIAIQVRGRGSLAQGSEPLIIVDGVPLAANNQPINNQFSILTTGSRTGLSPIASISPLDIESIEILKDADATAIYGSRGANGVVLITTKKGAVGKTRVFANFYKGWSKASKLPEMLNTREYVEMRKEALANDGLTPSTDPWDGGYAPDILLWDTTRETNFSKMMLDNTAHTYNGQVGLSGGNENIQLFLSAGYNSESTVFMGNMGANKISFTNNVGYTSNNKKFSATLASSYSSAKNNLFNTSLSSFLSIPPNAPSLYTPDGKLNWEEGGYYFDNPAAYLHYKYAAVTDNLLSNLQLEYRIVKGLSVRSSFGYNSMQVSEKSTVPVSAQIPIYNPTGSLRVSDNVYKSWIIELQAEYEAVVGKGKLNILIGSTFLQNKQNTLNVNGTGYKSDNLLNSLSAAATINTRNLFSDYKYAALFGRINYSWDQKYILNLTGRRDGSSRFGPGKQFANFGAVGAAWLFQEENFMQKLFPFISHGKIRTSYGLTGNDQIGNYSYLDTWTTYSYTYQGAAALRPSSLFNPLYGWETNRKFEAALELGLFKDRIYFSSAYFNNRSGNQLVQYIVPLQTGFGTIIRNFPALVQNDGYEFHIITSPIKSKNFDWSVSANISFPSNKLVRFDGLSTSGYGSTYVEGKSLNVIYKLNSLGTNPATGIFDFEDVDEDNTISNVKDYVVSGNTDPRYYGGIRNTLTFKKFELDFFVDFKKQTGLNYLYSIYGNFPIPGFSINQPKYVLDRWQNPGDVTAIQKFTTISYSDTYAAKELLRYSNGVYSDASFIRLKTVSISWQLPPSIFKAVKIHNSKIFVSAQNLFTISTYRGTDPEVQNYYAVPTLRTIAMGINLNL